MLAALDAQMVNTTLGHIPPATPMLLSRHVLLYLQLWSSTLVTALTAQTFFPSAVPLAVRSPTFSCWLDTRNGTNLMAEWPTYWNDQNGCGWAGFIKVDGVPHQWLGHYNAENASTLLGITVTPTRTILALQAGPMQLNVTFLSPIEMIGYASPFHSAIYTWTQFRRTGEKHNIQLYTDINAGAFLFYERDDGSSCFCIAAWVTNSSSTEIEWDSKQTTNAAYLQARSSTPRSTFTDVAEDSLVFHAISINHPNRQSAIGSGKTIREQGFAFGSGINLTSDEVDKMGTINTVLAHAVDLGMTDTISSVAWAVGIVRDPVLTFLGANRHAYYWSHYATLDDAIDAFITDFPSARLRALALDKQILQDARAVSQDYADLVSLAARQAMAGIEITVAAENGGYNTSDVLAFMKDVGNSHASLIADMDHRRVNPTETIYAAMPALIYLNASLIGPLLEPLLRFQNSSQYGNLYAASDLGTFYPSAPGNPDDNAMYGIENSGNMIIVALAHARGSGDGSIIYRYYNLFKKWADYLTTNTLIPGQQTPSDARNTLLGQNHGNHTNLAIKGIIAIQAMSEISQIMSDVAQATQYQSTAANLLQSWTEMASSSGSLIWSYGDSSSFGLMYNFLADKLLGLNLVPSSIYEAQSSRLSDKTSTFGPPLSSDSNSYTRSDWSMFCAAAAPDTTTRDLLISGVHSRASLNTTSGTFSNIYNAQNGLGLDVNSPQNGFATPAQGAMFSLLVLSVGNKTVAVPPVAQPAPTSSSSLPKPVGRRASIGAIVGGVLGGLVIAAVLLLLFLLQRRQRQRRESKGEDFSTTPRPFRAPPLNITKETFDMPSLATPLTPSSSKVALLRSPSSEATSPLSHPVNSPSSSAREGSSSAVGPVAEELRMEVANLRREMAELRAGQGMLEDAPPMYQ
ncbi:hypothetical protein MVEN_02216900 [Mycena venus]|uniref:DUF1793-domain-containing protein n=1 Tax=Mycena venus TaxID=2733690 RepID=A0A8H7CFP4_9AGAR|nr:hypothetical protein MVEN_02216900 [Mycena venus]